MNKYLKFFVIAGLLPLTLMGNSCDVPASSSKNVEAKKAREAANSITFVENAEIDNIKKRLILTSNPGQIGFIILLNQAGQPIYYTSVLGKVTSGSKRLTEPDRASAQWGGGTNTIVRASPSDEGTWGSSAEYIFFWNTDGQYIQWNGGYLYSDKPFRLKIEPLAVSLGENKAPIVPVDKK
jgi:hypothetical protein